MSSTVELSNLDRVLWPQSGFTKGALVDYYRRVAPALLPHLAGRPLTLGRFPAGVHRRGFAQTECRGSPPWMSTRELRLRDGTLRRYCVVDDLPSLMWVANQGAVELHSFLSTGDEASVVLFDLDPGAEAGIEDCCAVAVRLRAQLESAGLASYVKTSGYTGLHLYVPLNVAHGYDHTRAFARELAGQHDRGVTVDWRQNHPRLTTVIPYSLRAGDVPTVSTPVTWDEVAAADPRRLIFTPPQVVERVERLGDLFRPVLERRQRLPA